MKRLLIIPLFFILSACTSLATPLAPSLPKATQAKVPQAKAPESLAPTLSPTQTAVIPTLTPLPSPTNQPAVNVSQSPTVEISAVVWETDPVTVVLTYHQFAQNYAEQSSSLKVRMADFEAQLQDIYDAGFTLVSLEDWMAGNICVPEGRRPLILSMDDAYFNNQLRLDENGVPLPDTGIGILWNFAQAHPDFGFSVALFANLGDKLYGDPDDPNWEMDLAETIVWGIDHDVIPYNHFYSHPKLDKTSGEGILWELGHNDLYLRQLLQKAEREDLIPELGNIVALTYGIWPRRGNIPAMLSYVTPEGIPVQAVMEIDPIRLEKYMQPPWSPDYDLLYMPRHVASPGAVDFLVDNVEKFPQAHECVMAGLPPEVVSDMELLVDVLGESAAESGCSSGVYMINGIAFRVDTAAQTAERLPITTEIVFVK